ncbi:MAG: hypothetical protein QM767_14545 [Anaeromyxobacter sp.]
MREDSMAQGTGGSVIISPCASRAKTLARSKRNPSTPISSAQYSRQRTMKLVTMGWLQLTVLPQPVKSR